MELDKFIKVFAEQFDETPIEKFSAETKFREMEEWDSLAALTIIAMVDEEFEKRITGADIRSCESIKDLYDLILSK